MRGENSAYIRRQPKPVDNTDEINSLTRELNRISVKEMRVKDAYENGIDSLQEYKENRIRLNKQRQELEERIKVLDSQTTHCKSESEFLKDCEAAYNAIVDPDVSNEERGTLIRTVFESISFDRKSGELLFDAKS